MNASQALLDIAADHAARAERITTLERELVDIRQDLARFEKREADFKALGDARIEYPFSALVAGYGQIAFTPLLSLLTGNELAATIAPTLATLRAEISRREDEIAELAA